MKPHERNPAPRRTVITMAGQIGSGKTEVCRELHGRTGWEVVSAGAVLRKMASERGISVLEMNEYANSHPEIDLAIDQRFIALAEGSESLIVDSRMAWHFIPSSFKVYLVVEPRIAAQRVFQAARPDEDYAAVESALADNEQRQRLERERYRQLYAVDCEDWRNYSLIVDTTSASPGQVATRILEEAQAGLNPEPGMPRCWLSPKRLLPTRSAREPAGFGGLAGRGPAPGEAAGEPGVEVAVYEGGFLIVDGHAQVSAALRSHQDLIPCRVVAPEHPGEQPGFPVRRPPAAATSLSRIREWEQQHAFRFAGYPAWLGSDGPLGGPGGTPGPEAGPTG